MLYCDGHPDYHEMGFMQHYLRPGDGFVDVGANIGVYTLLAASLVGKTGRIDAFEPGSKALVRLRENLALNGLSQVFVHPAAVGIVAGTVQFTQDQDTTNRMVPTDEEEAVESKGGCAGSALCAAR